MFYPIKLLGGIKMMKTKLGIYAIAMMMVLTLFTGCGKINEKKAQEQMEMTVSRYLNAKVKGDVEGAEKYLRLSSSHNTLDILPDLAKKAAGFDVMGIVSDVSNLAKGAIDYEAKIVDVEDFSFDVDSGSLVCEYEIRAKKIKYLNTKKTKFSMVLEDETWCISDMADLK